MRHIFRLWLERLKFHDKCDFSKLIRCQWQVSLTIHSSKESSHWLDYMLLFTGQKPSELTMSFRKCLQLFQVLSVNAFVCASQQHPWVTVVILVLQIRKLRARVRGQDSIHTMRKWRNQSPEQLP